MFPAASAAAPGATESIHQRSGKCHADISKAYFDTSLPIDLTDIPTNTPGSQMVMAGETINFQCWYRDSNPATTSNFTDGLSIVFQ